MTSEPDAGDPAGSLQSRRLIPFGTGHRPKPIRNRRGLKLGDNNRVSSICVTTIAFLDIVEIAWSPGKATEQTGCNYVNN